MSEPKCIEALHMQKELDADGVFVGVSRQAIDETVAYVAALRAQVERLEAVWKGADHPDRGRIESGDRIALLIEEREHKDAPLKPRLVMVTALEASFAADDPTFNGYSPEDAKAWARESDLLAAVLRETGP